MKFKLQRKLLTVISMLLAGFLVLATLITGENADAINGTLGTKTFEVVQTGETDEDTEYYKSDFSSVGAVRAAGKQTATEVLAEGMVLLKNDNNALPLSQGSNVSLVGVTAYDPVYGGTGSGTISVNDAVSYVDSLTKAGFNVNPDLQAAYTSEDWAQYKRGSEGKFGTTTLMIHEAPWTVVDEAAGSSFAQYGDAAIFVVGRVGGEGYDLIGVGGDGIDNGDGLGPDYLGLNENELSVLEGLKAKKAAGEIKKIIVLVNYAGMIEGDFLNDPDIDAALWVGALGVGGDAVGQVLSGEVSPSGRLPDTMWMDNAKNPVNVNFAGSMRTPPSWACPMSWAPASTPPPPWPAMWSTRKACTWATVTPRPATRTWSWAPPTWVTMTMLPWWPVPSATACPMPSSLCPT